MNHEKALKLAKRGSPPTEAFDVTGRWINTQGSRLDLRLEGLDITGTFVGSGEESDGRRETAPVKGYLTGDLLSLTALWRDTGSITVWSGQMLGEPGKRKLKLLWRLVTEIPEPDEARYFWMSTFSGTEDFEESPLL